MREYIEKDNSFAFEKFICAEKPEIWRNEAHNLFSSAQVLLEFSNFNTIMPFSNENKLSLIFSPEVTNINLWHYRIIRMLWGFGFENILKGTIILKYKNDHPEMTEVPIKEIKSHNLKDLFKRSGIELIEKEEFYIGITEKCSIWMGRYPLPIKSEQMYEQRKPLTSREELLKRSQEMIEKYSKGEIPRIFCESDILHSSIGSEEQHIIKDLILKTIDRFTVLTK
jgi:hypothetical protein